MTTKELVELEAEQDRLEKRASEDAINKVALGFIAIVEQGRLADTNLGSNLMKISLEPVVEGIKLYFTANIRGKYREDREKLKLLFEKRERELAYIILNSVLTAVAKEPKGLMVMSKILVRDINNVISVEKLQKFDPKVVSYLDYEYKKRGKAFIKKRKIMLSKIKGFDEDNLEGVTKLGTHLLEVLINSGIEVFEIMNKPRSDTKYIALTDKAMKILHKHKHSLLRTFFTYMPMVVPPVKHTKLIGSGGYLNYQNISLVKQKRAHLDIIEEDFNKCDKMLSIVNRLQEVPWAINTRVLDVMRYIIDNNLEDPKSHRLNPKLFGDIPTFESLDIDTLIKKEDYGEIGTDGKFLNDEDYDRWYKDRTNQLGVIEKITGKRFGYMFAIDTAERYKNYNQFYFTYQFDYRYRLYPLQQHLNPQQTGNIKALLQLANGCVLDSEGLYWLKIHGANCYGYDKDPYNVRIEKITEMTKEIQAIAEDPLGHLTKWCYADSPFEFLAFCFSYSDYIKDNCAIIHTQVALDATCSGLQIYSGLLRDRKGAESVNVIGTERNDVYGKVADVGNQLLAEGNYIKELTFKTSDGVEKTVSTELEASSLQGAMTRRLTKRNVMTTPYSVTSRGMFDQVKDILTEDELDGNIWWKGDKWVIAKLIADINAKAISIVVEGATKGQEYIKEITGLIASNDDYLKWKTPFYGLPMVQRTLKETRSKLKTPFGQLIFYRETDHINKMKMLSSIAPNFIHQLDAMLMYRTVEKCMADGVKDFWLIHDSYGVLPNDVKYLNKNVREAFIELFEQDLLQSWVEQLGLAFNDSVMINTLDLDEVRDSRYIFS